MRKIHKNIPTLFKPYPWKIVETEFSEASNKNNETIFTIANGYMGVRGFFEEGFYGAADNTDTTTLINGIYEYFDYHHIWRRPGFPGRYHSIINQCNPYEVKVYVDDELVKMSSDIKNYQRTLNLRNGCLTREFDFTTTSNKAVRIVYSRFASQTDKHVLMGKVSVKVNQKAVIKIVSSLKKPLGTSDAKAELASSKDKIFSSFEKARNENTLQINYQTIRSKFAISCSVNETLNHQAKSSFNDTIDELNTIYELTVNESDELVYERAIAYTTNRDFSDFKAKSLTKAIKASKDGFDSELMETEAIWNEFWEQTDIQIDDDPLIQQGIRFSMFQIYQSTGKDGVTNIAANGLSGTAYSGHTFWDTEIFMMPMYIYTNPEIAKKLLLYRYHILPKAKERAKEMGDKGALFSWNSINGEECGHVFEAVTAQYHINNDIYYAIYRYYEATNDLDFIVNYGAEILFETSKCMAHRGSFIPTKENKFCINVVCGPDEYNPIVDNNMYTNLLTQKQLYFTLEIAEILKTNYPEKYQELINKCEIDAKELDLWKRAADNMYIPYSEELGMYMQDDNFIYKEPIDLESIPLSKLPLLTNLHPLNLWRYQVCKQADIVLLIFLCSDYFTMEEKSKIFDYYEPKTIHDSSLSASIHSIVACDIGYQHEAYEYLKQAARMDLDNVNRNTFFGLHAACMGATWMMMVNGYGGLRIYQNKLHFKPYIPDNWQKYQFKINFKGSLIEVIVDRVKTTYQLLKGESIEIEHYEKTIFIDGVKTINHEVKNND
jgi:alpha,alpha-trehalose phosphorylase